MDQQKIGKFIYELRKNKGYTQEKMAEILGVSNRSVSRWENGVCLPDSSLFQPICEMFNIKLIELLSGEKKNKLDYQEYEEKLEDIIKDTSLKNKRRNKVFYTLSLVNCFVTLLLLIIAFNLLDKSMNNLFLILFIISIFNFLIFGAFNLIIFVNNK